MGKRFYCIFFCALVLINSSALPQAYVRSTASIKASLVQGLSISAPVGSLNFGKKVQQSISNTPIIDPQSGILLNVVGTPNRNVIITFNSVILDNTKKVVENGRTNSSILFTPTIQHTGYSSVYKKPCIISPGNSIILEDDQTGFGKLYLWVGGTLDDFDLLQNNDFAGSFSISITY